LQLFGFFFYAAETLFKCSTKHNLELENSPHGAGAHQHKWIEVSQKKKHKWIEVSQPM